ncbi:TetR family transcriptional regulator [Tamaricihabitans halophyticus]|uniref:TetR family transcriptional regulator n=1 Tax=Tamaricihabitans halophyticus TaxID=1262583 RepID=A0A4R2R040_9PSEU|nr:TetR/AcrR family transcriptional regulator [Tamaricihabitans halophyticus]TCP55034.1 TetR family transcriptional regulator [Tamaricihabitans halophyticus]
MGSSAAGDSGERVERAAPDRRNRILDAAERIFAEHGYHGTTLRQVAGAAEVKLSLLVYHFESKLRLYVSVFERRQYVNDERLRRLTVIEDLTAPDAVERVVRAFLDPVVELAEDGRWYRRLVLREAADPSSQDRPVIGTLFDPMARQFIAALRVALPGKREGFYEWAYLFAVGALTQSAFDDRLSSISDGTISDESNPGAKADLLRSFIVAGLRHG